MFDTLKLGILLSQEQLARLQTKLANDDRWQWAQIQQSTGDIRFVRLRGLAHLDQQSFRREIFWDIPCTYEPDNCFLTFELSLPKFWYGHNIHLLYDVVTPLRELGRQISKQLDCEFPDVLSWQLFRCDVCYAWRCPSQVIAQQLLDSLKHLHYPRKQPTIRPTSIMFAGTTYSFKFYLKLPEFIQHDRKALIDSQVNYEWVEHLERLATGVIRCEATLRRKYLKRQNINLISDLVENKVVFQSITEPQVINDFSIPQKQFLISETFNKFVDKVKPPHIIQQREELAVVIYRDSGNIIRLPYGGEPIDQWRNQLNQQKLKLDLSITVISRSALILQYFLNRFVGVNKDMQEVEQVQQLLLEKYKPNKVTRLIGFWLYIQKFGSEKAREIYGKTPYYRNKVELKEAGVSLIEPPKIFTIDEKFIKEFKLEIPSLYVVNSVDDFRQSQSDKSVS